MITHGMMRDGGKYPIARSYCESDVIQKQLQQQKDLVQSLSEQLRTQALPRPPFLKIYVDYFRGGNFIEKYPICSRYYFDWLLCYGETYYHVNAARIALPTSLPHVSIH